MDLSYFRLLKVEHFKTELTLTKIFPTATTRDSDDLLASYNLLLNVSKSGKHS